MGRKGCGTTTGRTNACLPAYTRAYFHDFLMMTFVPWKLNMYVKDLVNTSQAECEQHYCVVMLEKGYVTCVRRSWQIQMHYEKNSNKNLKILLTP